jgi:hypothetical protein
MDDIERAGLLEKLSTVQQNQVSSHSLLTNRWVLLYIFDYAPDILRCIVSREENISIFLGYVYIINLSCMDQSMSTYNKILPYIFLFAFDLSFKTPVLFILCQVYFCPCIAK